VCIRRGGLLKFRLTTSASITGRQKVSYFFEQLGSLEKSDYEDAKTRIREQICLGLQKLSLDLVKRDKALLVARKLGIDFKQDEKQENVNFSNTERSPF
jgi:hypothetical protein